MAEKKSQFHGSKHAAILIKGGKMISLGINKSKAGVFADPVYGPKEWHSEADCLLSVRKEETKNAILYVAGVTKTNRLLNSKPCNCCQAFIKKFELKAVYFCNEKGEVIQFSQEAV